jgi:hypothetical protein
MKQTRYAAVLFIPLVWAATAVGGEHPGRAYIEKNGYWDRPPARGATRERRRSFWAPSTGTMPPR